MVNYHRQRVEILVDRDTDLYRRLTRVAARDGVTVESVVDMLVTVGTTELLENGLRGKYGENR